MSLLLQEMEKREGNGQVKAEHESGGTEIDTCTLSSTCQFATYFAHIVPVLKYYYVCCRDGVARKHCTESKGKKRAQQESRKSNGVCISRMYVTHASDESVRVKYVSSHTNHDLSLEQSKFLPLPKDVKDGIAIKLNMGIPIERILDGK